jgi:hypothetical protein
VRCGGALGSNASSPYQPPLAAHELLMRRPPPPTHLRQCWPPPCIDKGREYYLLAPMFRDALPPPPPLTRASRDPLLDRAPCGCARSNRSRSVEDQGRVRWSLTPSPDHNFNWNKENGNHQTGRGKSVEDLLEATDEHAARATRFHPPRRRVSFHESRFLLGPASIIAMRIF